MRRAVAGVALGAVAVTGVGLGAQERSAGWCDERGWSERERVCEVREERLPALEGIRVDGGPNGGIDVEAWDGEGILVEARVEAWARDLDGAEALLRDVRLEVDGGRMGVDGPSTGDREGWSVSWRIRVPPGTDLDLETLNGGIGIEGVTGTTRFRTTNGSVSLVRLAGSVEGRTQNGGLSVVLEDDGWQGAGLDAETQNGGVTVEIPAGYSAELETGSMNGSIDIDFPVTVQGRIGREIRATLGDGGPTVRAVTTNGGVRIRRR